MREVFSIQAPVVRAGGTPLWVWHVATLFYKQLKNFNYENFKIAFVIIIDSFVIIRESISNNGLWFIPHFASIVSTEFIGFFIPLLNDKDVTADADGFIGVVFNPDDRASFNIVFTVGFFEA